MPLTVAQVHFGPNKQFSGYLATVNPAAALPGVIVVQEAWGVDAHIEDVTRRVAQAGYVALAPDVFARGGARPPPLLQRHISDYVKFFTTLGPGVWRDTELRTQALHAYAPDIELRTQLEDTQRAVFGFMQGDAFLPVLQQASEFMRQRQAGQPLAVLGFCIGGHWALQLAATDPALAAAVVFYGMPPKPEDAAAIRCPLLGLYAGEDPRINEATQPFAEAVHSRGGVFERHTYPGVQHAFFNDTRPSYDLPASRDALVRLLTFLRDRLATAAAATETA